MSSAATMMVVGDVIAQELERFKLGDDFSGRHELDGVPENRRLHLRHYHTRRSSDCGNPNDDRYNNLPSSPSSVFHDDGTPTLSNWDHAVHIMSDAVKNEYQCWDGFRTSFMCAWTVAFTTPFFLYQFRMFDRYLPAGKTPIGLAARLSIMVMQTPLTNGLFFVYGTSVHHTMEWIELQQERQEKLEGINQKQLGTEVFHQMVEPNTYAPYNWEMLLATTQLKLQSELFTTCVDSAKLWIPVNTFNFTFVPPHLRPFGLIFFNSFWNCYLSLAQHRDVALPEDVPVQPGES